MDKMEKYTKKEVLDTLEELQRIARLQARFTTDLGKCQPELEAYWKGFESALWTFEELLEGIGGKRFREIINSTD